MVDEALETMRRWDSLPEGQRHPKNLAILAVESLALPDEHRCRFTILQDADYWNPVVSIVIETPEGDHWRVEIREDDDPCSLAARVRTAIEERAGDANAYAPSFVVADSLDDLRGPATGTVELPNRLLWNPSRPFDLSEEQRRRSLIRIVLREARSQQDLADFIDRGSLVDLWPSLGLPRRIAAAWEAKFPELAERTA